MFRYMVEMCLCMFRHMVEICLFMFRHMVEICLCMFRHMVEMCLCDAELSKVSPGGLAHAIYTVIKVNNNEQFYSETHRTLE